MSIASGDTEVCRCGDKPLSHLLNAAKGKLQDITLGERCHSSNYPGGIATTMGRSEVRQSEGGFANLYPATYPSLILGGRSRTRRIRSAQIGSVHEELARAHKPGPS